MTKRIFLGFLISIAVTTQVSADVNILTEGGKAYVKRNACLQGGGRISSADRRYYICDSGKYEGLITQGPANDCAESVGRTRDQLSESGDPGAVNEATDVILPSVDFIELALGSLNICAARAVDDGRPTLKETLLKAKKTCDESAQEMSAAYKGHCYLKIAEFAKFVIGQ